MSISTAFYGTLQEANDYFSMRLHEAAWTGADITDRPKALWAATQIIDSLNFKGYKHPVFLLLDTYHLREIPATADPLCANSLYPSLAAIIAAEATQELEFPRGLDTEVPEAIRRATYEIAHTLLDGKDPEQELENLGIVSHGYASVRTTYSRTHVPVEHLVNGVPSSLAWRWLVPFLRDSDAIKLARVS